MHRHDHEWLVVPLVTDTMHVVTADGTEIVENWLSPARAISRPAGSEHPVENRGDLQPIVFVEVERLS